MVLLSEDPGKDILMMCYFAYPFAGVPPSTSGFATTSSASATATQTSTSLTVASTSGTTSTVSTTISPAPKLPSEITGKTVEEIIKEWNSELQERTGKFRKQANAIAEWDNRILQNRDILLRLEAEVAKVVETQSTVERQLELIETHQQEVDKALLSVEEEAKRIYKDERNVLLDDEAASTRDAMYEQAEIIERELEQMAEQIKTIIQTLNAYQGGELDAVDGLSPLDVVVRILNNQLSSLMWIDEKADRFYFFQAEEFSSRIQKLASQDVKSVFGAVAMKIHFQDMLNLQIHALCGMEMITLSDGEMHLKDLVSWSALVSGYARNGFGKEALLAFREMHLLGLRCNEFTLPSVLKACSITKGLMLGKQVHGLVMVTGFESDVFVANTLVVMYAKCGAQEYSRRLFDLMPERNVVSWNALFSCYVQSDIFEEALGLFREMILRGIRPDEYSLSCILNACTGMGDINQGKRIQGDLIKRGYDSDPFSANALVDMYAKGGDLQDSMAVFEGIGKPDIVSWNAVVVGCVPHEYHDWALKLFRRMKNSGTCPNMFTLSSALKACAGLGLEKFGRQLHSVLLNMNIKSDPFVSVGLIDMYCKSGLLEEAKAVYWLMPQKDLVALNAMISGLSQNGEEIEALYLCSDMYKEGIGLNETTMCAILNSTASLRAANICKQVHALSVKSGLQSDIYVSNSLIDSYGKCENVEDACKVFEECPFGDLASFTSMIAYYAQCGKGEEVLKLYIKMQDMELKPDPFVCSSLLNACANLSAYEQGKLIHVHILKFRFMSDGFAGNSLVNMYAKCGSVDDAEKSGTYVLLANIYVSNGMWEHMAKVRRRMKESNVKKEPGISWMEVKDKVHTFIVVGDRSHSRSGEIYAKLDELRDLMNKAGYVPMVEIDLHDVEESEKELLLFHHSEKLAVAFGLIATPPGAPIRIKKNLRVCLDCHSAFKFICKIVSREIVVRDMLKTHQGAKVDFIDRLPTPCGLVRSSVALDHPKTKFVTNQFSRVAQTGRCSFTGNGSLGSSVSLSELREIYDVVVLAYGAESDRVLSIPGEDLSGIHLGGEFVWWYNGHPYYRHFALDLKSSDAAVILGQVILLHHQSA
ncbi:hypothetical protein RHGRI_005728 [Rhododendron griersonianum]|uniref:DYW domain-containing protein n=1 Tax=Rhododendron griersonianum TaxID=479676 RepID=A0AAV6LG86_9ERIC|nr:hypothetical protein RHGRI_005728 [Rhododendron griersonianum]